MLSVNVKGSDAIHHDLFSNLSHSLREVKLIFKNPAALEHSGSGMLVI